MVRPLPNGQAEREHWRNGGFRFAIPGSMKGTVSETKHYDVIIAGGGFVGMTQALALSVHVPTSLRVALVDAEPREKNKVDARASALSAASKGLLSVLGLWQELAENAQPIASIEVTDSSLDAALRPALLGFDDDLTSGEFGAYMVENADLHRALVNAIAKEPSIEIVTPESVIGYAATSVGVQVRLGSGGEINAKLLIAADGKRSRLREAARIKCVGWSYPQIGIVTTVAHENPHHGNAVQHFYPAGPFAILPLKGNRSSIVWTEDKAVGEAITAADETTFLAELAKRFGSRLGNIALAGPGLNIGFRDVAALTEIIVDNTRLGLDIGTAFLLARYERWRRFDSAFSATVMDGLNRLFSNDNGPLRALRDLGLGIVDQAPWLKRILMREAAGISGSVPKLLKGERV